MEARGVVRWFGGTSREGKERRYGFITADNGQDVFVHLNEVKDGVTLKQGDLVSYTEETKDNRRKALGVKVIRVM